MTYNIKLNIDAANKILSRHGLDQEGNVQVFFTNEVFRASAPYTPFDNGVLSGTAVLMPAGFTYIVPYARYLWEGKLMVDPLYKIGAFYDPVYGFWSRPGIQKELTNKDLKFKGAPMRGSKWVERAWIDNKATIIDSTQKFIDKGGRR